MLVAMATFSLHELYDSAVMVSFYVKYDNGLRNCATMWLVVI
jgi:hypothetical protein